MNSDELIDQIISKGIDYDKNQITVDSVLEDLINTDSNISNLVNPINKENKDGKKEPKQTNNEDIEKILKEETSKININDLDNILKEDTSQILNQANNIDIEKILKEEPKDISKDLLNEILNENNDDKKKEIKEEIKKEISEKNETEKSKEQSKDPNKEIEKEIELLIKQREEENLKKKEMEKKKKEEEIKRKEEEKKRKEEEEKKKKKEEEEKKRKEEEIKRKEQEKKREEEEEKLKKKKEEERKKLETFIPQFPNPVDFVQYIEILRVNTKISGEMQNFILQNHRKKDNKYNISVIGTFPEIYKKISINEINLIYVKKDYLIVCNKKSEIFIFSQKYKKCLYKVVPQAMKNKEISCIDITNDFLDIVCGYMDGTVAFINIRTSEVKSSTMKIHRNTPCLELKIYKKEKENEVYFISCGGDGMVCYSSLIKLLFWRLTYTVLIKNDIPFFMIKLINISLKNQYYYSKLSSLKRYALIGSSKEIKLFCIEPKIEEILEIKKPNYILENNAPDAQIGIGRVPEIIMRFAKKDEKNHLLLIVSWGNIIYFYQLTLENENITSQFKEIGYYINMFNILRIGFLNSSVVYCLDKSFGIKILNSRKINQGKINFEEGKLVIPKKNDSAEIEKSRHISEFILSEKKLDDFRGNKLDTYFYSIIDNDCSLLILGEKQLYNYDLVNWIIFLKELQKNNDFLNLFSVGIEIYNGKMTCFSNLPDNTILKGKVGDFLKEIIPQYVELILKDKKSNIKDQKEEEKILESINIIIEVCIELEAIDFLLRKIVPLFEEKEYGELFLTRFEPFILCDKIIKYVLSSDIIINFIDLYDKKGKLQTISQMLLHINILAMDKPEIKKKLEKTNLFIPLIYIYHNGKEEDYFTPLQKMFDYFISLTSWNKDLINEEDNLINYTNAITKNTITLSQIQNTKEYIGHRILWYIKWCLTGKKFPDNLQKMKDNLFDELLIKISYWLLKEKVLDELLKFDPKNYFIIYKNILTIKSLYIKLKLSLKNEKIKKKVLAELESGSFQSKNIEPISLVDYLVTWCKKKNENKIFFYLYDFIIVISKNSDINIKKELRIESASYILRHYKQTIKIINNQERESLIKIIIEYLKDDMLNKEDYKQVLSSIIDNQFDEVKLFLLEKIGNYGDCLKIYLDKNSNIKDKDKEIFKWINRIINKPKKDSKQYEEFLQVIKNNIFPLISISLNKFYYLTRQIFQNLRKEIIEKLEIDKNIQLEYIELLIQSLIKKEFDLDENTEEIKAILTLHIKLLCELKHFDKIVPALQSYPLYPFEECLSCCEKAKAHEACIYLYVKEGSIEKAFDLSILRLDSIFKTIVKSIDSNNDNYNDEENKKLLDDLNKNILEVITICENNDKNIEDLWFNLLDILYLYENDSMKLAKKNENDSKRKKKSDDLYQNIAENIKELTEKMCSFVSIKRILKVVTDKNKISGFKEYKDLIIRLLGIYSNSTEILYAVKGLLTSLIFNTERSFQNFNIKGDVLNEKCDKCKNEIKGDKIFRFYCKHTFHKDCIIMQNSELGKEAICPICKDSDNENKNFEGKSLVKVNSNIINEINKNDNHFSNKTVQKLEKFDISFLEKNKVMIRNTFAP